MSTAKNSVLSTLKVNYSKSENQEVNEENDGDYEPYGNEYAEYVTGKEERVLKDVESDTNVDKNIKENKKEQQIHEQYNGDYEAYHVRYANYSKPVNAHRETIVRKLAQKKRVIILAFTFLAICGFVIGLSAHFTAYNTLSEAKLSFLMMSTASLMVTSSITTTEG